MNLLNEDLDDSALFYKSHTQKRKASSSINAKNPKQLKLNHLFKAVEDKEIKEGLDTNSEKSKVKNIKAESSFSSYFKAKEILNTCPLCLKQFKSDAAYSSHMKICAKTHKMTTKQLLEALELQKKQMEERRKLGLCTQNILTTKKTISKKKEDKDRDSYDLALGLALSNSFRTYGSKTDSLAEKVQVIENEFAADQVKEVCEYIMSGKKKNENGKKSFLKERTAEDRQRIIIEKVALVLLDGEKELLFGSKKSTSNLSTSDQLTILANRTQQLWNCGQSGEKRDWYVDKIKTHILENEINMEENEELIFIDNFESEISKLNLPQEQIHKNWEKMINNSKFSDVIGRTKDCKIFYLHSVVIFARFPNILEKDYKSVFEKYNLSTVLIFLEYLYCGTLNNLVRKELKELCGLALDFDFTELVNILNCLENNFVKYSETISTLPKLGNIDNEGGFEDGINNVEFFEKDLFVEDNMENLTQKSYKFDSKENDTNFENESNAEKSYWSFLMHEKKKESTTMRYEGNESEQAEIVRLSEERLETTNRQNEKEENTILNLENNPISELERQSEDSTTKDLGYEFKTSNSRRSSDCIILSSGSESHGSRENCEKSDFDHSRTPSPIIPDYEIPYYDPYDNFHCFSEEQFSHAGIHSQSLITGDISSESLKVPDTIQKTPKKLEIIEIEKRKKSSAYCSTPVTARHSFRMRSAKKGSVERSRKRKCDLSTSRIIRKSLGLQFRAKNNKSNSFQRKSTKRKESFKEKNLAEVLTDSILKELSKSSTVKSSTPVRVKKFMEITPISTKEELGESVTPSPNYSTMGEALLKEQLSKYGLKKNLGKNKARKILRYIYEELHPLYNTETGKIVKMLPTNSPKVKKKLKLKKQTCGRNVKSKQNSNNQKFKKIKEKNLNSSKEFVILSDGSSGTLEGPSDDNSEGSDMENLSETLTQSAPSNPVDLPSAFVEYLENNPEYYQKILMYEPIWLEELQKKLKESFKKHFKLADLIEFLDQKCITFRSATQVRNTHKKNEKRKEILRKRDTS